MSNEVQIIISAVDKASRQLDKIENSGKSFGKTLGNIALTAGAVAGTMGVLAVAGKKAMDFGRRGAEVTQTAESFDLLIQKVDAVPDLLDKLRVASKGTIDDMSLMSSTETLLAGASGDLAKQLANSTPKLMEIAKAANKLNPALGDTNFMYQSIATGVKRAQPLILDNLGLTIKLGPANEKMAKALGKTVEQLTADEKATALLNATLEAGDVLINQVGGNTDSATDSFDRLNVSTLKIKDTLAQKFAPAAANAAEALAGLLTVQNMNADAAANFINTFFGWKKEVDEGIPVVEEITDKHEEWRLENNKLQHQLDNTGHSVDGLATSEEELEAVQDRLKGQLSDLDYLVGGRLGPEYDNFTDKAVELTAKSEELHKKIAELGGTEYMSDDQQDELDQARKDLEEVNQALDENAKAHEEATKRILFSMLEQQAASDGLTQNEITNLTNIAEQWGIVDTQTATAMRAINGSLDSLDTTNPNTLLAILEKIYGLPSTKTFTYTVKTNYIGQPPSQQTSARAAGGPVSSGVPYWVGERGPELFVPSSSGSIIPNNKATGGYVDNSVTNITNLNPAAAAMNANLIRMKKRDRFNSMMGVA